MRINLKTLILAGCASLLGTFCASAQIAVYDVVIMQGRVIDPETQLDAVRNIGINGHTIAIVTDAPLQGKRRSMPKG
jgi:hypothetical protein